MSDERPERFPRYRAWRERVRARRSLDLAWRLGVTAIGSLVLVAGVAMLALPGPGWAAIFIGLAILGSEYDWASRLLDWARDKVAEFAEKATDPRVRRRNQLISIAALLALVAACWFYVQTFGWPGLVSTGLSWVGIEV